MSRKKILWLCSWYPGKTEPFNGDFVQRHARAAALYNDICVIHVAGDDTGKIRRTEQELNTSGGLTEHILYYKGPSSYPGKLLSHYRWFFLFKKAINRYLDKYGEPDIVHVHVPVKAGLFALWLKRKYGIPYVITEHWGIYNSIEVNNYAGKSRAFKQLTRNVFKNADIFHSVSYFLAAGVNKLVLRINSHIIPNATDTDFFYYKEKENNVFRFIHVSNMAPLKNAEGILRSFQSLLDQNNNVELVIVGDTDNSLREYAMKLNLPGKAVSFRREMPYQEVAAEMQKADCFILFSNIENSPCVIGEALCCGLPVIVTDVGGVPELVNETNSVLIKPKDEKALTSAMQQIMIGYAAYDRKKIAEEASNKFSYSVIGKRFDEVYSRLTVHS